MLIWSSVFLLEILQQVAETPSWGTLLLWWPVIRQTDQSLLETSLFSLVRVYTVLEKMGFASLTQAFSFQISPERRIAPAGIHLHPSHFPTLQKLPWKHSPYRLITHVDMICFKELGFIQHRELLLTLVSFYHPRDLGRMLPWDQMVTLYSLLESVELFESLFPQQGDGEGAGRRVGGGGYCDSGNATSTVSLQTYSWVIQTRLFIMWWWPEKWQTCLRFLPELA